MKIRIKGNTLRLRLTRSEVAWLQQYGEVLERAEFALDETLTYGISAESGVDGVRARFRSGAVQVFVAPERIRAWATSDDVGIYSHSGPMEIAIEKDFRCLTRPEEQWDEDVYPNPEEACGADDAQLR